MTTWKHIRDNRPTTELEGRAWDSIKVYEAVGTANGMASRSWEMVAKYGWIDAMERAVSRSEATIGFQALMDNGLVHATYEQIIVDNPKRFSPKAMIISKKRLGLPVGPQY